MSEIRVFDKQEERVESGPIQFGNDWPGVFLRGDNALFYAMALKKMLEAQTERLPLDVDIALRSLHSYMASAVVGPGNEYLDLKEPFGK